MYLFPKTFLGKGISLLFLPLAPKKLQNREAPKLKKNNADSSLQKIFMIFYIFFLDPDGRVLLNSGSDFFLVILVDFILIFEIWSKNSCSYHWHPGTRNSCAQLGAPTGSVPSLNHHSIAIQLARYAHIRFDLCARIEIFVSCPLKRGSGSTTCRAFRPTYPRFFLRFDRFPNRIWT